MSGHIHYSSGHEWGYWLTDYVTARALWQPEAELETHLAHVAKPFGDCEGEFLSTLSTLISLQTEKLFDARLVPYASAEDIHDDLGYAADIDTHPPRVPFAALRTMNDAEREAFEGEVLSPLGETASETGRIAERMRVNCAAMTGQELAFCAEIYDATSVTAQKLEHAHALYSAVLAAVRREDATDINAHLERAVGARERAATTISRREQAYRWPLEALVGAAENPTRYPFGLYRQANTQCLWKRQELQVDILLETGEAASPFALPTCQD